MFGAKFVLSPDCLGKLFYNLFDMGTEEYFTEETFSIGCLVKDSVTGWDQGAVVRDKTVCLGDRISRPGHVKDIYV